MSAELPFGMLTASMPMDGRKSAKMCTGRTAVVISNSAGVTPLSSADAEAPPSPLCWKGRPREVCPM